MSWSRCSPVAAGPSCARLPAAAAIATTSTGMICRQFMESSSRILIRSSANATAAGEREERLALLLTDLTDRVQRGSHVALEEECRKNPDFAAELRELWGAVMIAQAAGSGSIVDTIPAQNDFPSGTLTLPARFG